MSGHMRRLYTSMALDERRQAAQRMASQKRNGRFWMLGVGMLGLGGSVFMFLNAMGDNLMFYLTPTQVLERDPPLAPTKRFRLGGIVREGSLVTQPRSTTLSFTITDLRNDIDVSYTGALPDLFREGSGAVAEGYLQPSGIFKAEEVLAKHDENYMPPEVAKEVGRNQAELATASAAATAAASTTATATVSIPVTVQA